MNKKRSSVPEAGPPEWLDEWVRTALILFNEILSDELDAERLAKNGFGGDVSADELYIHCVLVAANEWQRLASEKEEEFTQRRFLTFCRLYEQEAKYIIQTALFRNGAN